MKQDNRIRFSWLLVMAWRDSRRNRGRLFLFISSVVLGIAALVATLSFGNNLREDIDDQAKTLVGADLIIERAAAVVASVRALPDSGSEPSGAGMEFCFHGLFCEKPGQQAGAGPGAGGSLSFLWRAGNDSCGGGAWVSPGKGGPGGSKHCCYNMVGGLGIRSGSGTI